ncbi:MAG: high-potential iron-sulfur protein [Gammaproteobacteria bacterium]|jgi:hypothetical protein
MSQVNTDQKRRRALKLAAASVVAVPLTSLATRGGAIAGELPHLSEDDRAAKALSYVHDAADAPANKRKDGSFCKNCNLIKGEEGAWRGCDLFPGKAVNENGWCAGWVGRV